MTVQITTVDDERLFNIYLAMRNAPRDTLVFGVHPDIHKVLAEYSALTVALAGNDENSIDLSSMALYHANVTASVTPFIEVMRAALRVVDATLHIVNVLAEANGKEKPFTIGPDEITVQDYGATVQSAISVLSAVLVGLQ